MPFFLIEHLTWMIEVDKKFCVIVITKLMFQILRG